ncbi:MAG TPA: hypothetical protein H9736_05515 [Candidatus Anaerotruncus excrementipullorum]|uniref:DUF5050 domain-containing protein n=1 Tax=Candidatus Anaerotruncus excrementipullorum TaxID=2838465 RepID=A0A9D1WTD9_9FIRM|nr:hypothetical protein [Candidatus Anaerotruncus excrementipullorum]
MEKKLWAAVMALLLLVEGCAMRGEPAPESSPSAPAAGTSASAEPETPESPVKEQSASSAPTADPTPESSPSPEVPQKPEQEAAPVPESQPGPSASAQFTKVEVGVDGTFAYGVFALDSEGDLCFYTGDGAGTPVATQVRDFSATASGFYVLQENGDLYFSETGNYQEDQPLTLLYRNSDARRISDSVLTLADGSLLSYNGETSSWDPVDVEAVQVDAGYFGAAVIDAGGVLWRLDRESGALTQIAEDVIHCSYADRNKVYYSDDLWYVTADNTLHLYQTQPQAEAAAFPEEVSAVSGCYGQYLVVLTDGSTLYGGLDAAPADAGVESRAVDLFGIYCAILDGSGEIRFGTLQPGQGLEETLWVAHP